MDRFKELNELVISGNKKGAVVLTQACVDEGCAAEDILNQGLLPGMKVVGQKFEDGEYFIPEMLISARALIAGLDLLKPLLAASNVKPVARVLLGTVKGDIHDIGKNIVGIMFRGGGFEITDAGIDVSPERFVELARESDADIVGLSALLTTTMPAMKKTIEAFEKAGMREQVKIMVGGAPVTEKFCQETGADGYAANAAEAVTIARKLLNLENS